MNLAAIVFPLHPPSSRRNDPGHVTYERVGTAGLDFTDVPGQSGRALFSYTVNGNGTSKSIRRMPL